jgi:hypothetical protein
MATEEGRMIHQNSIAAYHAGNVDVFPQRAQMILRALVELGTATDRQICDHLEFHEMNAIRPRLTELIQAGIVEECGDVLDETTNRTVRVVRIAPKQTEFGFAA